MIPTKWAVALVVALIGYVLLQPRLNQWFGWSLPSIASLVGDEKPTPKKETIREQEADIEASRTTKGSPNKTASETEIDSDQPEVEANANARSDSTGTKSTTKNSEASSKASSPTSANNTSKEIRKPPAQGAGEDSSTEAASVLTKVGQDRYESPAGLVYGRGSEEGHRLKHVARHLEDQPNRPGSHGVFTGSMEEFLIAIDDAFTRAKRGAKGTKKTDEEGRTVYIASFEKPIGFLGGESGKRKRNPPLKRLQVVVERNAVITAFPIQ
ncbi:MAG: hypothetical protein ABL921_31525 [Pirellula sp.]